MCHVRAGDTSCGRCTLHVNLRHVKLENSLTVNPLSFLMFAIPAAVVALLDDGEVEVGEVRVALLWRQAQHRAPDHLTDSASA